MLVKQYSLLILFLSCLAIQGFGQVIDLEIQQNEKIKDVPVNSIIVDFGNNKWIGTEMGLIKINDFEDKTRTIKTSGVMAATLGENERGWMCTYENKIAMFDREVSYSTNVPSNEIITCIDADQNFIWLGTTRGLYKISLKSKKDNKSFFQENSKLPSNRINDIHVDERGSKWIATEDGLVEFDNKTWKVHLKKTDVTAIEFHEGKILATGNGQIWRLENGDWEELLLPEELTKYPIEDLCYDSNGHLWIAGGILARLDENWIPYIYNEQDGFSSSHPTTLAIDQRNNLWVGTAGSGVFKVSMSYDKALEPIAFAHPPKSSSLQADEETSPTAMLLKGENTARGEDVVTNALIEPEKTKKAQKEEPVKKINKKRTRINKKAAKEAIKATDDASEIKINEKKVEEEAKKASILDQVPEPETVLASSIDNGEIVNPVISEDPIIDETPVEGLNGRAVQTVDIVNVEDKRIKVAVWNGTSKPNDVISIYYNGEEILSTHLLTHKRHVFTIKLKKGEPNKLVVYAHTDNPDDVKMVKVALLHRDSPMDWMTVESSSDFSGQIEFMYKMYKR